MAAVKLTATTDHRLDHRTWPEVEAYLAGPAPGIFLPVGSTEQHGPVGLIGTDALCAEAIAGRAAALSGALLAPSLAYAPAPFNTAFPGTVHVPEPVFEALAAAVIGGLRAQGFAPVYVLNAHGANLAPLRRVLSGMSGVHLRSWWDFEPVNALRRQWYGAWEGMHATPSETAITRAVHRAVHDPAGDAPPEPLPETYIRDHAGDRHGPPAEHRARFPDGRVGAHSALGTAGHGRVLLETAAQAVAADYAAITPRR